MHTIADEIKSLVESLMGSDFYIEILPFKTKTHDPYEKRTKNRFELRNCLYKFLKDKKNFIFEDGLDLRNVPQKIGIGEKDYYSSLSHTDDVGVFTFDSHPVGVDFENCDKVKKEIVARVSRPTELKLNSNFQIMWSIKEAAFKSIPFMIQPKIVSEIRIESIVHIDKPALPGYEIFRFTASVVRKPKILIGGIVLTNSKTQLSVARAFTT